MGKIAAVAMIAVVLNAVLKRYAPEFALLVALCASLWILWWAADGVRSAAAWIAQLIELSGLTEELVEPVAKVVALSVVTRLTAELCRGSGEGGMAAAVETAGTILALVTALPLIRAVTMLMTEMLT